MVNKKAKLNHSGLQVFIFESYTSKNALKEIIIAQYYSILIIHSGYLWMQINNREIYLSVCELISIPKKTTCEILNMSDQLQISQISFTSDFAFKNSIKWPHIGYFEFFILQTANKIALNTNEVLVLIYLFKYLNRKLHTSDKYVFKDELILYSFNLLLYELARFYSRSSWYKEVKYSRNERLVIQFFKLLDVNCRKQHSVKFYADALFVTAGHLNKIVKEVVEKSPKQLIETAIVMEAKIMLQNSNLTILYISEELQFSTTSFFSNFFKRHTSLSPSEYRSRFNFH
ncbi:helix-turn-helix domain-containing protein [Flavobacterium turcicum]|uniref:AraC family transcriptional regulator n=1 Tax=Flavobacterium turcicum TaxID=2764718 RepID=A0ABR7JEF0_9FLAO|nr:helix-turn-helix domain-containing protein [Flavobacterium turcicum]MBC5862857.1 AraC family transcriptional regulator [Flavobacterium turcicum]NHL01589.1 AraC family transcriptional regulator [Flavobacterium turcicum]